MKIFNEELAKELEKIARPAVKNDPIAMFASDEDLLIYEHFFINGMEYNEDTISNDMTEKKTIEELAEAYADLKERRLTSYWKGLKDGYIAGHDKARNQDIEIIKELVSSIEDIHENWITPNARYWGSQTNDDVEDAVDKANKFIEQ